MGYSSQGCKESARTEATEHACTHLVNTNNLRQTGMYPDHNLCYNKNAFAKPPLGHVFIFKNFRSWL